MDVLSDLRSHRNRRKRFLSRPTAPLRALNYSSR
jgi:hypothetical protein